MPMAEMVSAMCPGVAIEEMVMVGDRLDTDRAFAQTVGCRFALVLSGVTSTGTPDEADIVAPDLAGIADAFLGESSR